MPSKGGPNIITDGLVFAVDAADKNSYPGSGTTWKDLSGNGNDGTLTNGPTFDGANGGSLVFDDSDDIILCGSSNNITGDNLQTCTLSAWFKTTVTDVAYITSLKRLSTGSSLITLHVNAQSNNARNDGYAGMLTRNYANTTHNSLVDNNGGNGWRDGKWHYLVGVVNGLTRTIYIDGVQRNTDSEGMQNVTGNTADFTIGGFDITGFASYGGNISQVAFYNRALTAQEISQNYNALKSRFNL